ncbi:hypothetical protein BC937DRAFT_93949 [Endogone sp. FLAS-F59071]|nr:hypothetical protein BC937DRAFT_93949 [Endogone sp. FLAS-F59071]|eukprot:RUS20978.1 hypothetical protein BC937DRAFT_93949 [Endogone sp. FLAS-F59071]
MGFMEGNGPEGVGEKFRDAYLPAFIANYKVWPLVQFINFRFCPLPYRVPFVSTVGIFWNGYLSYLNNAAKEQEEVQQHLQREKVDMIERHREIALKG